MKKVFFSICLFVSLLCSGLCAHEKPKFVIVSLSYNNAEYCIWSIKSCLEQEYDTFRVIFLDDCSTDNTFDLVYNFVRSYPQEIQDKVTLLHNDVNQGAMANHYHVITDYVNDDEIVVNVDGDDALANKGVLTYLANIYSQESPEIWLTYGQFKCISNGRPGFCSPMPERVVKNNAFRSWVHLPSHLRTFRASLFKKVKKEDFCDQDGNFFSISCDSAMMLPMIEMASRGHFMFIPYVLYLYNDTNPLNDHRVQGWDEQQRVNKYIRSFDVYEPLASL